MTTLSICGNYLAVLRDLQFFFIRRFTFRFQVFRVEGECGVRRGESLWEEGLAQLASAQPSMWEFPSLIPRRDLLSFNPSFTFFPFRVAFRSFKYL